MGPGFPVGGIRVIRVLYYRHLAGDRGVTFNVINRRTHLYLGLALIPWVLVYGLSSLMINHSPFFNKLFDDGTPPWNTKFEQEYHRPVPEDADL